jgi:hypothetical protein
MINVVGSHSLKRIMELPADTLHNAPTLHPWLLSGSPAFSPSFHVKVASG